MWCDYDKLTAQQKRVIADNNMNNTFKLLELIKISQQTLPGNPLNMTGVLFEGFKAQKKYCQNLPLGEDKMCDKDKKELQRLVDWHVQYFHEFKAERNMLGEERENLYLKS